MSLKDWFTRKAEPERPQVRVEVQTEAPKAVCPDCGAAVLDITTQESAGPEFMCMGSPAHFWGAAR